MALPIRQPPHRSGWHVVRSARTRQADRVSQLLIRSAICVLLLKGDTVDLSVFRDLIVEAGGRQPFRRCVGS